MKVQRSVMEKRSSTPMRHAADRIPKDSVLNCGGKEKLGKATNRDGEEVRSDPTTRCGEVEKCHVKWCCGIGWSGSDNQWVAEEMSSSAMQCCGLVSTRSELKGGSEEGGSVTTASLLFLSILLDN